MYDIKNHPVNAEFAKGANINREQYDAWYKESIESPDTFWADRANEFLDWYQPWSKVSEWDFSKAEAKWFIDAKLNVTYNCIDRHLEKRGDQVAIIWEGDDPNDDAKITYKELHEKVCRFANALKERGVKKGDRVCIYMPMIPEAAYAMLAAPVSAPFTQ